MDSGPQVVNALQAIAMNQAALVEQMKGIRELLAQISMSLGAIATKK